MGDAPQLPTDLASFLEWPEDANNKQGDAWTLSTPLTACLPIGPETTKLKSEGDQWHSTIAGEARPKSNTTSSTRPATASGAKPQHYTMPDPKEWVRAYAARMRKPLNWWLEFLSFYWEVQVSSTQPSYRSWPRERLWVSGFLQPQLRNWVGGSAP